MAVHAVAYLEGAKGGGPGGLGDRSASEADAFDNECLNFVVLE